MTGMVEKCARAICFWEGQKMCGPGQSVATREVGWKGDGEHNEIYVERHWRDYVNHARAAIAAMREPTLKMVDVGPEPYDGMAGREAWQAMIDAALGEAPIGYEAAITAICDMNKEILEDYCRRLIRPRIDTAPSDGRDGEG